MSRNMKNTFSVVLLLMCGVFGLTGKEEPVLVIEGDSITLHTGITRMQEDDVATWRVVGGIAEFVLVEIRKNKIPNVEDLRFRHRVQVNKQTGDVTITNMRIKLSGLYKAEISTDTGTIKKEYRVTVNDSASFIDAGDKTSVSVTEGDSVTLHTDIQTQTDDLIVWRFGPESVLIAKDDKEDNNTFINDVPDGMFRGRLKLDDQTGSLNITNTKSTDTGDYKLKISSNSKQTLYKTFSVYVGVSEPGLSPGDKAGIVVGVLLVVAAAAAAAAAGVIYHRRRISKLQVFVGDPVTLYPDHTSMQTADEGEWWFGDKGIIAQFNKKNNTFRTYDDVLDGIIKGSLELNKETGSLFIRNARTQHTGLYKLKIISRKGTSNFCYNVIVMARRKLVQLEGSVTLNTGVDMLKRDDDIMWTFGPEYTNIAQVAIELDGPTDFFYDARFENNLSLSSKTGDLTINNITTEHIGLYGVRINSDGKDTNKEFRVTISGMRGNQMAPDEGQPLNDV